MIHLRRSVLGDENVDAQIVCGWNNNGSDSPATKQAIGLVPIAKPALRKGAVGRTRVSVRQAAVHLSRNDDLQGTSRTDTWNLKFSAGAASDRRAVVCKRRRLC